MLPKTLTARFCGGPWHNRIVTVECHTCVWVPEKRGAELIKQHYHLTEYHTPMGTRYWQYVHESLVRDGMAAYSTYRERIPVWRLDRRKLEAKLRNRMRRR